MFEVVDPKRFEDIGRWFPASFVAFVDLAYSTRAKVAGKESLFHGTLREFAVCPRDKVGGVSSFGCEDCCQSLLDW